MKTFLYKVYLQACNISWFGTINKHKLNTFSLIYYTNLISLVNVIDFGFCYWSYSITERIHCVPILCKTDNAIIDLDLVDSELNTLAIVDLSWIHCETWVIIGDILDQSRIKLIITVYRWLFWLANDRHVTHVPDSRTGLSVTPKWATWFNNWLISFGPFARPNRTTRVQIEFNFTVVHFNDSLLPLTRWIMTRYTS